MRMVAAKIQAVNGGTGRVDEEAKTVRKSVGEVIDNIVDLRETLVTLVRTSVADADRRVTRALMRDPTGGCAAHG